MSIDTEAGERDGPGVSAEMADHLARAANALAPQLADVELARARLGTELFPEQRQVATLGRYVLLERIGAGAMGVVYAAYDPELESKGRREGLTPRRPRRRAGPAPPPP